MYGEGKDFTQQPAQRLSWLEEAHLPQSSLTGVTATSQASISLAVFGSESSMGSDPKGNVGVPAAIRDADCSVSGSGDKAAAECGTTAHFHLNALTFLKMAGDDKGSATATV